MTTSLCERAKKLGFHGLVDHWEEYGNADWLPRFLEIEEEQRSRRSLERRIRLARLGRFKALTDFDWSFPTSIDREQVEELFELSFLKDAANVIFVGPNGVGKTTLAKNLAYKALLVGHTVLSVTSSEMLNDLAFQDTTTALHRRLKRYTAPSLLLIDEVGYLSYDSRHGDLLFEVISRRHGQKPILLTTNKPFAEWNETFPNSSCVTALIDRLVHRAEILKIDGDSYRAKEAKERAAEKAKQRARKRRAKAKKKGKQ